MPDPWVRHNYMYICTPGLRGCNYMPDPWVRHNLEPGRSKAPAGRRSGAITCPALGPGIIWSQGAWPRHGAWAL